ncbi:hypothetical protein BALOs_1402 [Halobacteriovorax sp. BALOs_7]|uniref:hypothetical protein n=1 Tax=Halobacteriovorax sp. BALOs_7 TaxID=2109558 RepID=UPI000EA1E283|nr:hypothetical protein [Halobacteriovorax sp. BALOs_7]AYF44403.1 hypothetical protein BALOs_1402 [Halobacteriovorax sp. BALOs_7]
MNRDRIYNIANAFGFTFTGVDSLDYSVSPERFIVDTLSLSGESLFREESRLHTLLRTWVRDNSHLLRPELLVSLGSSLEGISLRVLGSICLIAQESDTASKRWNRAIRRILKIVDSDRLYLYPENYPNSRIDQYLSEFGIHYRSVEFQDERKFRGLKWMVENNPWVKNRILMTVSARADIYTYLSNNETAKEKEVCTELDVGKSSFYSIKKSFELIRLAHN